MRAGWLIGLLWLAGCVAPAVRSDVAPAPVAEPGLLEIPVPGTGQSISARLCRPTVAGPVPLAVINHGSPARAAARPGMRPVACAAEAVQWFTARGFAVLLPLRRGYGAAGGRWAEGFGACDSPDYARAGRESALDIEAAILHALRLPGIRPGGVVVVGQSAGGWGALALAADRPAGVAAVVNMAGGRGGWAGGVPGQVCAPGRLVAAAGEYGRSAILPTLWLYTANDSFFGPELAAGMHRAFTASGGRAELRALPAFGTDGHALFFGAGGSAVWGPMVEAFLRQQGFTSRTP
ncbi:alpha/beta hydrolase family protein [Falsiroseomonas sp. E2-1-a20]|uniref:alpha/beta hydrolase family protein n=1 Tax=Falsiroseomonas sp. E2-1-a20 TaxID=3239300 RepID=UPI003F2E450B